jgi:hypothetical protein
MRRVVALLALIGLPMAASAQSLTSAVTLYNDPMTTGAQKIASLAALGWTEVPVPSVGQFDLLAGSIGPAFNVDMPVEEMARHLPQIGAALADAHTRAILSLFSQGDALLLIGVNPQPDTGLEHLTCLYAGPPTDEIAGFWQDYGGQEVTPLMGREVLLFQGSVSNMRDDVTYSENMLWARVPSALSALTDSYRYERLETAPQ